MPVLTAARLCLSLIVLLIAATACRDVADPTQPAGFLVLEGANNGEARVGSEVRVAFRAVSEGGAPARGVAVSFVVVEGGGSVFAGTGLTNAQGEVREVWTLGMGLGIQTLEARTVDQDTGNPRTLGRLELVARAGIVVRAIHADTTVAAVGQSYDLRDALAWMDQHGNYWIDSSFTVVSVPAGMVRDGYQLLSDHEVGGDVIVRLDTLTVALPFASVIDVRQGTWQLAVTCTDPLDPAGPAHYAATLVDPAYSALPYDLRNLGEFVNSSPWPEGHRLMLGMQGMVSYGGSTRPFSASREGFSIWVEQRPGYIDVEASHSSFDGAMPPLLGRLSALPPPAIGWEGQYQTPVVDGAQKVSAFCGHLALNTPRDMQLRTASQVQVLITKR